MHVLIIAHYVKPVPIHIQWAMLTHVTAHWIMALYIKLAMLWHATAYFAIKLITITVCSHWAMLVHVTTQQVKVALGVSPQFFSIWIRVLNHNKYVEIKHFSKVDIKQNNISTVILLIKFLVYQWDPFARKSCCLHIYLYFIFMFYLISNFYVY